MTIDALKSWLADNALEDQWWVSCDSQVLESAQTLEQVSELLAAQPTSAVLVMHPSMASDPSAWWPIDAPEVAPEVPAAEEMAPIAEPTEDPPPEPAPAPVSPAPKVAPKPAFPKARLPKAALPPKQEAAPDSGKKPQFVRKVEKKDEESEEIPMLTDEQRSYILQHRLVSPVSANKITKELAAKMIERHSKMARIVKYVKILLAVTLFPAAVYGTWWGYFVWYNITPEFQPFEQHAIGMRVQEKPEDEDSGIVLERRINYEKKSFHRRLSFGKKHPMFEKQHFLASFLICRDVETGATVHLLAESAILSNIEKDQHLPRNVLRESLVITNFDTVKEAF